MCSKKQNPEIDIFGDKYWYVDGKLHRIDGPAIEQTSGTKHWYVNGRVHRLDGPAVELSDGSKVWYIHGKKHRLDGPAVEWDNGDEQWCVNDKYLNGPLELLEHGAKLEDIAEYLTPREIAQIKLDK